jgi:aryl-alcohol dehydrogenase-like predicted oxidoreductase/HEAT repeat protein
VDPSRQHLRRLAFALLDPAQAPAAVRALAGPARGPGPPADPVAWEGLCALLDEPPGDAVAVAAARALARRRETPVGDALRRAALGGTLPVRRAALRALDAWADPADAPFLAEVVRSELNPGLRQRTLRALAALPPECRRPLVDAFGDPAWRVRWTAVRLVLAWQRQDPAVRTRARERLGARLGEDPVVAGCWHYLEVLSGALPPDAPVPPPLPPSPLRAAPWWDDDPPVLEQRLRHLTGPELRAALPLLPALFTLSGGPLEQPCLGRIRRFAAGVLRRLGMSVRPVENLPHEPSPADLRLRRATALAAAPAPDPAGWAELEALAQDEDYRVRAAALTPGRAGELWRRPEDETSWVVLRRAAEILGRPLSQIAPACGNLTLRLGRLPVPGAVLSRPREVERDRRSARAAESLPHPRTLGRTGPVVSPLGLSGRYRPPVGVFRRALDAGVNLFFWEPTYTTQTRFWADLVPRLRDRLVVAAGSYAGTARAVREDLDDALRELRVERLGVFLLFWVRSPGRLDEDVLDALDRCRAAGKVQALGLSTHLRPLAAGAVRDGWDVVMVRHSLAHTGAEEEVFPLAAREGTGVLTFSALCYGRLLHDPEVGPAPPRRPSAAECYRYCLSQPGVSACLSAPRDRGQLEDNLPVLQTPTLDADTQAQLRPYGAAVYAHQRLFASCLRGR